MRKRSTWQGQPDAFRAYNRRRTAEALARQDAAREQEARAGREEAHVHVWGNWEYVLDYSHEVCVCRVCGFARMRGVTL